MNIQSHPIEIPQWLEAKFDAGSNNAIPIIATEGVIVNGVIKRKSNPMRPEYKTTKLLKEEWLTWKFVD